MARATGAPGLSTVADGLGHADIGWLVQVRESMVKGCVSRNLAERGAGCKPHWSPHVR